MDIITKPDIGKKAYPWQSYPAVDCTDEEALAFAKKVLEDKSRLLRWNLLRMARNAHAYAGRFVTMDRRLMADSNGGYRFKDIDFGNGRFPPEPDNRIAVGVDNTVSRLTRNEYEPTVIAERHIPEWEAAARLAKDLLIHDLEKQAWPDSRDAFAFDLTVFGTCGGRSLWDEKATEVDVVASPGAAVCPTCQTKYASATLPLDMARMGMPSPVGKTPLLHSDTWQGAPPQPGRPAEVTMRDCPMCEQPSPLQPFKPLPAEVEDADPWGRPLGLAVPKGEGLMQVLNMFGVRPQNGGAGVEPATCKVIGYKSVQELEWIAARHPDYAAELAKASIEDIQKLDPTMGDPAFGSGASQQGVFDHHGIYGEVYVDPIDLPGLEMGRRIVICGDKVLRNDELMVEVTPPAPKKQGPPPRPRKIARATHAFARYKRVPNQFWGKTPVDDAVPLNRRLIAIDWLMIERQAKGLPFFGVPPGTEIHEREDNTGAYRYVEVELANGDAFNPKDMLVNPGGDAASNYLAVRQEIVNSIEVILGPAPFESGVNQPSVKSGDHLQILADETAQKRVPQERALTNMHERLWTAHLEQTWAFKKDESEYEVERAAGKYEQKSYKGTDLSGQTRVKVENQGSVSKGVFQAKAVQSALTIPGLVDIQTDDAAREKALELMNIPKLNENYSIQVSGAEAAFTEFMNEGLIPTVDPSIHDPWIWYRVLGKRWQEDECQERLRAAGWSDILAKLGVGDPKPAWERQLEQLEATDAQQRAVYEGFPPEQWQAIYTEGQAKAQQQNEAQAGMATMTGAPAPPAVSVPAPPADGEFLPDCLLDRIVLVMLQRLGPEVLPPEEALAVLPEAQTAPVREKELLVQMYACINAARIAAERKKLSAMTGGVELSAPGGGATTAGTEPVQGQAVTPAPGGGAAMTGQAA